MMIRGNKKETSAGNKMSVAVEQQLTKIEADTQDNKNGWRCSAWKYGPGDVKS
jgi:hypothetical protein